MPLVGLPPAFVPPVVAVPAANAIVPFIAGSAAAGGGAAVASVVAAPLLVGALAGLAVLGVGFGVAQLWGYLNDRQGAEQPGNWLGPADQNVLAHTVVTGPGNGSGYLRPNVVQLDNFYGLGPTGLPPDNATVSTWYRWTAPYLGNLNGWSYHYSWLSGSLLVEGFITAGILGYPARDGRSYEEGPGIEVYWTLGDSPDLIPETEPIFPTPAPNPQMVPEPLPEPQKSPSQPAPLPLVVPALPAADPVAPPATPPGAPTTTPANPPAVRPLAPPLPSPALPETPTPEGEPTENGTLAPRPVQPPAVTPPDVHVVNGSPVRSPGPAPTPEGIAKEVGRVEEKLAMLLDPKRADAGGNLDRLGELYGRMMDLINVLTGLTGAGAYTLSTPCELDEAGARVVSTVSYGASLTSLGLLSNKIDALAELLQVHKDLKQPICRQLPPVGQPVTVNFVQID